MLPIRGNFLQNWGKCPGVELFVGNNFRSKSWDFIFKNCGKLCGTTWFAKD